MNKSAQWLIRSCAFVFLTEFREKVEDQFPQLTEAFNAASGIYLSAMPKRLRDKILVDESDFPTSSTNPSDQTNSTTSTAPTASTAQK